MSFKIGSISFVIFFLFSDDAFCWRTTHYSSKPLKAPFRLKKRPHDLQQKISGVRAAPLWSTEPVFTNAEQIVQDDHTTTYNESVSETESVFNFVGLSPFIAENPSIFQNGVVLAVVVFLLVANFLTVDSDQWRGWTWTEVGLRLVPDSWQAYEEALLINPIAVKSAITAVTYLLGDWLAQVLAMNNESGNPLAWLDLDRLRLLRGFVIGSFLGVLAHYYYNANEAFLSDFPVWAKIAIDQTLYLGVYNTFYYVGLGLLSGKDIPEACGDYVPKAIPLITAGWKLWPAVGVITYAIIPLQHRLLWVDFIEILYSAILSTISNGKEDAHISIEGVSTEDKIGDGVDDSKSIIS